MVEAWPDLPEAVRVGVLAMVEAARGVPCAFPANAPLPPTPEGADDGA